MASIIPVEVTLGAFDWLQLLGLGGLVGALGQGIRTLVGLKKINDAASGTSGKTSDMIDGGRLIVSLAVGFVAGALAAIGIVNDLTKVTSQQIFALAAAGYAGADFIEGFVRRVGGTSAAPPGQEVIGIAPKANSADDKLSGGSPLPSPDGSVG